MKCIIIAAMSADRIIGSGAGMPWHVPEEYAQFLRLIDGQAVIMGRRSWEIFGADLTTTRNFVVTRSGAVVGGATAVASLDEALAQAAALGKTVFIAGGASIYTQALQCDCVDEMYLSTIRGDFTGDTSFPDFQLADWVAVERTPQPRFEFVVWRRCR